MNNIYIKASLDTTRDFLLRPDVVFRLNPSWYVKEIKAKEKGLYAITLYDDRTDETCQIIINIEVLEGSIRYKINSMKIEFILYEINPVLTKLSVSGDFFRAEDLPYWLKGLKSYIQLEAKQSKIIKGFLDRFWLSMMPHHRRISIIIIIAEGIALIALILVMLALKIIRF